MRANIDLQNDHDLRTELLKEDLTKTGRDRRGVAYSLATKAQVQKKLPNPSRLMLWTDGVSSARSGDFIKAKPDLYGDGKYLYYFKEDFWPENFETELGEEFYPQTVICRMSVGRCFLSRYPQPLRRIFHASMHNCRGDPLSIHMRSY